MRKRGEEEREKENEEKMKSKGEETEKEEVGEEVIEYDVLFFSFEMNKPILCIHCIVYLTCC